MNLITISKAGDNEELWTDNLDAFEMFYGF